MNETRRLFEALENLTSIEAIAPLKWKYEIERAKGKIFLPPPNPETSKGEFQLGKVIWNETSIGNFGLRENEFPQHISIFGRTGSGKTNCAFLLIQQFQKKTIPFLIFDWKQSYRHLTQHQSSMVQLYTPGYFQFPFYFNPLDLSNIPEHSREAYLRQLLSVLLNVYFRDLKLLSVEGVEYLLLRGFDYLKREKNQFTFLDLYHWAAQYKPISRERDWKASLLNVLYKLTTGPLGEVLNPDQSISLEEIIKGKTIIELQWLGSPKDKSFLIQSLLLQIYYHFSQQNPSQNLKFLIVIEEAHNILLKHLEDYETIAEIILRQIREYGVGICLLDQHPSLMSLPAFGTYTTICFNLRAREDIQVMTSALNLEEDREYISMLRRGQAIVKLQDRYIKPFLVGFTKARIERIGYLPTTEVISPEKTKREVISHGHKQIAKEAKKLLIDMYKRPLSQIAQRYKDLNLNPRKGNQLKETLIRQQLISPININIGKGRIILFDLTEQGRQFLREGGISPEKAKRKGSLLHQYWQDIVKKKYEGMSYGVLEEVKIGEGKSVDLAVYKGNEKIAIEIETGKSDFLGNIRKCQEGKFGRIIVVATSGKVKRKIEKKMEEEGIKMEKIVVVTGNEMVKARS